MSTASDLVQKWTQRRAEWGSLAVRVDGEKIASEILADLADLTTASDDVVTLQEASRLGGYSSDHLQRMVAQGRIANVGKRGAPRIRRADVPTKPGWALGAVAVLPAGASGDQLEERRRIAADARAHGRT